MSRAYRIRVSEGLRRVIKAEDYVSTQLELLPVLPQGEMGELLAEQLAKRGFAEKDGMLVRRQNGVTVSVDPATGTVTAKAEVSENLQLEHSEKAVVVEDWSESRGQVEARVRSRLRKGLEQRAEQKTKKLQQDVSERLERELLGLKRELDQATNRTIAEALKRKAAQLGRIKELSDDPQSGALTIVVEV